MPFDHLVHWVPDLDVAMDQYRELGFHVVYGGEHQGRGTHSALCHVGLPYIELLAVHNWPLVHDWQPGFSRIEEVINAGGGAMDFVMEVNDVAAMVARLHGAGIDTTDPTPRSRQWPDGGTVNWTSAHCLNGPEWRPSFTQWDEPAVRRRADLQARGLLVSPQDHWALDHLVVETADPVSHARWLSRTLNVPPALAGPAGLTMRSPGCSLTLTSGPAERITEIAFARAEGPWGEVAGLRFSGRGG